VEVIGKFDEYQKLLSDKGSWEKMKRKERKDKLEAMTADIDSIIQKTNEVQKSELAKIGVQGLQPVAFTRALQTVASGSVLMGAGWDYTFGNREDAFTNKGDFKGWNQFRKSLPFFANYYDFVKRIENSKDLTKILQWEQFSKWR
jgi:hypothetical protein